MRRTIKMTHEQNLGHWIEIDSECNICKWYAMGTMPAPNGADPYRICCTNCTAPISSHKYEHPHERQPSCKGAEDGTEYHQLAI